jgi:hypothetical protein
MNDKKPNFLSAKKIEKGVKTVEEKIIFYSALIGAISNLANFFLSVYKWWRKGKR